MVSDRAKALIQLAEHGLECLSMPDFLHCVHAIVKSYALAIGRRLRQAQQALQLAEAGLERHRGGTQGASVGPEAQAPGEARRAEVRRWEAVHRAYRHHLETRSLSRHPCSILDAAPQTSAQVASRLQAAVEALEAFARRQHLPVRHDALATVRKQVPALAALVDCWWRGVQQDGEPCALTSWWRQWVYACLLPMVYWERQMARTRCRRRKATRQEAWAAVRAAFDPHTITQRLAPRMLADWHTWATDRINAVQRASAAVEGRHGYLAPMHHNQRGLPKRRYKGWTVLHNCAGRAADGTTPASRFCRQAFPHLFETVLAQIEALPRPRQRTDQGALCH